MHKRTIIAALAACIMIAAFPHSASAQEKSFFESLMAKFFKTDNSGDPAKTGHAPFVKPGDMDTPTADKMGLTYTPYSETQRDTSSLAEPHRDQDQVGEWLSDKVSESLNFKVSDYDNHYKSIKPFMASEALQDYGKFMDDSTILRRLKANHLQLHAFVEGAPLLINQGAVEDRYRWLYDVPVTLTFLPEGVKDYDDSSVPSSNTANYRLMIRIQVGRVSEDGDGQPPSADGNQAYSDSNKLDGDQGNQGLKIESWEPRHNDMAL